MGAGGDSDIEELDEAEDEEDDLMGDGEEGEEEGEEEEESEEGMQSYIIYSTWGYITLMIGLIIGVIRMVMDFSYPEPLCMEHDTRPSIVANVSFQILFKKTRL